MQVIVPGCLVIIWALQIAWIARTARDRGRSILAWPMLGGAAGIAGAVASRELIARALDPFGGNTALLVSLLTPIVFVIVPMATIAVALARTAPYAPRRTIWRVHAAKCGTGRLSFRRDGLDIEWD